MMAWDSVISFIRSKSFAAARKLWPTWIARGATGRELIRLVKELDQLVETMNVNLLVLEMSRSTHKEYKAVPQQQCSGSPDLKRMTLTLQECSAGVTAEKADVAPESPPKAMLH